MSVLTGLLGPQLLKGTDLVPTETLKGAVVALYFSAHWCPPCKAFTPQFVKAYKRCKASGKSFEVVFVSSDRDETSFREYYSTMPWHAVPYADRARQETLKMVFSITGIPRVVLVDGATGSVMDPKANSKVVMPSFPSTLPRAIETEDDVGPLPFEPVQALLRHHGETYEIEIDPEEDWEMIRNQIFSVIEVPPEQQRLFGLGFRTGQISDKISVARALAIGRAAQRGSNLPLAEISDNSRSSSSSFNGDPSGTGHHRGKLDSSGAWCSSADDKLPWYQMDLGDATQVAGVVIAPRRDHPQWVTKFKVSFSSSQDWTFIHNGAEFAGNTSNVDAPLRIVFSTPVSARSIRIHPTTFHNHCSMRADILLASSEIDKIPEIVVISNFCKEDPFEIHGVAAPAGSADAKMMEEQHLAMLQAKLSSSHQRLQSQVGSFQHVRKYDEIMLQRQAMDQIPVADIDACTAVANSQEGYEIKFMRALLQWFKHSFFSWTNAPPCEHCGSKSTKGIGATQPTPEEQYFGAGTVEVAQCEVCGQQTRFPRYNDPGKLLETRTGRCGEWANCFTLVCRALGYEARHVHDWTDHVWTEVYSDSIGRWVHADSCEAALDCPLMYEKGWGKKLTYCLAFGRDNVCDTSRRYTINYNAMLSRRSQFPEQQLARTMEAIDEFARERGVMQFSTTVAEARKKALAVRASKESEELAAAIRRNNVELKEGEQVGRTSGDKEWREQRGELGANAEARRKAVECSEKGVALCGTAVPQVPGSWILSAENISVTDGTLKADLRCCNGSLRTCSVKVEPGVSYSNEDGSFAMHPSVCHPLPRLDDGDSVNDLKVHHTASVPAGFKKAIVSCRWKDQGAGNQKGLINLVVKRGNNVVCRKDCFGIAPHEWKDASTEFSSNDLSGPAQGDAFVLEYRVGGGGGHRLMVEDFSLVVERDVNAASSSSNAAASATTAPDTSPKGPSKEEMQALMKASFTELVAGGMAPNEAAVRALEVAKEKASKAAFQPPGRGN